VREELPYERFADDSFAAEANRKLGPFKLAANESGKLGCGK
jgi:hypothetical protein